MEHTKTIENSDYLGNFYFHPHALKLCSVSKIHLDFFKENLKA